MENYICTDCGFLIGAEELQNDSMVCPECKNLLVDKDAADREVNRIESKPAAARLNFAFSGSTKEYFRIWIVNTFLTIITLGVYLAWAKVRTRKYFYANTELAGHRFDYLANPLAIFKGYCIVGTCFAIYMAVQYYNPLYTLPVMGLFFVIFPYLVYKSLRFKAHNTAYRNIRFRFSGNLWESYRTYMILPLGIPLTLGILYPYIAFRQKKYLFHNFAYGKSQNEFSGTHGTFYSTYFFAGLFFILLMMCVFGLTGTVAALFTKQIAANSAGSFEPTVWMQIIPLMANGVVFLGALIIHQYVYASITNYCWRESAMGKVRFSSTLRSWDLIKIMVTNILAIIFSLGFLAPWAKIRKTKYLLDHLAIITEEGALDEHEPSSETSAEALGEVTTEFFDIDIGL